MTEKIYVIPADGLQVRDPVTREPVADEGAWKPRTTYWLRRIKCGDVTIGRPLAPAKPKAEPGPKPAADKKTKEG